MATIRVQDLSDARLVADVAARLAVPREAPADSFVLHAPLELAARAALLPMVKPSARAAARAHIAELGDKFERADPVRCEHRGTEFGSLQEAAAVLAAAIHRGDLDATDAAAEFLGKNALPTQLPALLGETVLHSLAAAAHGSIFLYLLPRVAPRGDGLVAMLRPLARELARGSALQLDWVRMRSRTPSDVSLMESIVATPQLGVPGSTFIFPIMHQAEANGLAARMLDGPSANGDLVGAARVLQRCAALTMLQEPLDHAPYGWTHCLTMTQGTLGIATACSDPRDAIAVAATYVFGFRAALAQRPLVAGYEPERPSTLDSRSALDRTPQEAAAAVWYANGEELQMLASECISRAATHEDAHLVKYTLACLDAAAFDRSRSRLYLAAMAHLNAFWNQHPTGVGL